MKKEETESDFVSCGGLTPTALYLRVGARVRQPKGSEDPVLITIAMHHRSANLFTMPRRTTDLPTLLTTAHEVPTTGAPANRFVLEPHCNLTVALDRNFRSRRGIAFESPNASLNPRMRVEDGAAKANLRGVRPTLGQRRTIPVIPCEVFAGALGGDRQRLVIVRAVAGRATLCIADEMTFALDVSVSAQLVNLVLDLRDELQFAGLFITHVLAVTPAVAQRVETMKTPKVVAWGTSGYIANEWASDYTEVMMTRQLDAVPVLDDGELGVPR